MPARPRLSSLVRALPALSLSLVSAPPALGEEPPPPPPTEGPRPTVAPTGPSASDPDAPNRTGRAYTPRSGLEVVLPRLGGTPCLSGLPASESACQLDAWRRYLGSRDEALTAEERVHYQPRIVMADVGLDGTLFSQAPWVPVPADPGTFLPGEGYTPRLLGWFDKGVGAQVDFYPRGSASLQPSAHFDFHNPFGPRQDAIEVTTRLNLTHPLGEDGARLMFGIQADRTTVGASKIAGGAGVNTSLLLPRGSLATHLILDGHLWQEDHFYTREADLTLQEGVSLWEGRLTFVVGLQGGVAHLDEALYLAYTGADEVPFTTQLELSARGAAQLALKDRYRLTLKVEDVLLHREDLFLDSFFAPTGPQYDVAVSALLTSYLDVLVGFSQLGWDGTVPDDDGDPTPAQWRQQVLSASATVRF